MSIMSRFGGLSVALLLLPTSLVGRPAIAQSITPAADGTGTNIQQQGGQFHIQGGQYSGDRSNLFHSFERFGLDAGEVANFLSQPDVRNILGRVVGGDPSVINGLIQVTGGSSNLFLINPAGILFGANASLNVPADFTATTATSVRLGNNWFNVAGANNYAALVGAPNVFAFATPTPSALFNAGNLQVGTGQRLALIGGSVLNTGQLSAPGGELALVAVPGESLVRLSQSGMVLNLELQPLAAVANQPANWTLPTTDLPTLLTAGNSGNATGATVNAQGNVVLTGSGVQIDPQTGTAIASGQLNTANPLVGQGGEIVVLGDLVAAIDATIDASGASGGGTVLMGGDYQGQGAVPNATQTFVNQSSTIRADALEQGDGGRVILWADDRTQFQGQISARGGNSGGDGGFVEVSGKETLVVEGSVDVTAPQGKNGNILLDPRDIIIENAGASADDNQLNANVPTLGDPSGQILFDDGGTLTDFTISNTALTALTGNVLLQADRDIIFQSGANLDFTNQTAGETITFQASSGDIAINANITTAGGTLSLQAGGNIDVAANVDIDTNQGSLELTAANAITINQDATLETSGGNANLTGSEITFQERGELKAGSGQITLEGNEIQVESNANLEGNNTIQLQPLDPALGISIGDTNNDSRLNLDSSELDTLRDGFSEIIIGRSDGTGAIQLNDYDFQDPLRIAGGASLAGPNRSKTWTISGQNSGSISGFTQPVTFGNIENLVGGDWRDTFRFVGSAAQITGGIDGGGFRDTLNYSAYTGSNVTVRLGNEIPGTATAVGSIFGIERVIGNRAFNNTLVGENRTNVWSLSGNNSGRINGGITFSNFQNLKGGSLNDTFRFRQGATIGGIIDGGQGLDTLDYRLYSPPLRVDFENGTATGTAGIVNLERAFLLEDSSLTPEQATLPNQFLDAIDRTSGTSSNAGDLSSDSAAWNSNQDLPSQGANSPSWSGGQNSLLALDRRFDNGRNYVLNARVERLFDAGNAIEVIPVVDRLFSGEFDTYFGQTVERELLSLQAIQARLQEIRDRTGKQSVLIYTFAGSEMLHLVLVAPGVKPIQRKVPEAHRQALLAAVKDLQAQIADVTQRDTTSYLPPAQQLHQWLIAPLETDLQRLDVDTLVFVLDKGLRRLPLATLHDGQQFLVEQYGLGIIPSVSLTDMHYASLVDAPLLAMGMSERFPDRQNPLPAVPVELSTITKQRDRTSSNILLNKAFTLDNLQQQRQAKPFRIVHLATHGRFNVGAPDNSYLQLWDRKLSFQDMGKLDWDDPPVELLVLSACHTAVGTDDVALGFAGLAVQTGAKSVLASLWYVNDTATLALIVGFYDRLNASPIKADALRQAQIAMLRGEVKIESGQLVGTTPEGITLPPQLSSLNQRTFVHPYYWAGFTMVGNPW